MSGMKDATIRQLEIFAAAVRNMSFTRAANELRITQAGVSMAISQLEFYAGAPLFERMGRRIHLTHPGEKMARTAERVLAALEEAEEEFAILRGLRGGRISIAVVSTAKYFAPKLIAMFQEKHPGIELKLSVQNREAVIALLTENRVDLAIMGQPPAEPETIAVPFADHPLVVVAASDHPLARKRRVPTEALADQTFLVREPGSGTRAAMEKFFAARRVKVRVGPEMSSNETIKQAVMAGMGLAFISQHTVGLELETNRLAVVRAEGLPVVRHWHVVHRKEKRLSPAAEAFERFVLEAGPAFLATWPKA